MEKKFNYSHFLKSADNHRRNYPKRLSYTSNKTVVDNLRGLLIKSVIDQNKKINFDTPFSSKSNNLKKQFLYAELTHFSKGDSLSLIKSLVFYGFPVSGLPLAHVVPYLTYDVMQLVYGIYAGLVNKNILDTYKEAEKEGSKVVKMFNPSWWNYIYRSDSSVQQLKFIINLVKWDIDLQSLPNQRNMKAWIKRNVKYNNSSKILSLISTDPKYSFIKEIAL